MSTQRPTDRPAVPSLLRELNERVVLDVVREHHPIHRAEVARRTGLSKPTVGLALKSLSDSGLVRETGVEREGRGRAGSLFEPVADVGLVLGIDIGARFVRAALADLGGSLLGRVDVGLTKSRGAISASKVAEAVERAVEQVITAAGVNRDNVVAAVVGSPGVIDPISGVLSVVGTIPALDGVDLAALLSNQLNLSVTVENDVNLMALGEQANGHGRDVEDFAVVSVGTGLGAGLILRGELYRGTRGAAGEIDFVPFREAGERIDPSAAGIVAVAEALSANRGGSANGRTSSRGATNAASVDIAPSAPELFEAARHGDPLGRKVVDAEARAIAVHLATLSAVVDLELVVLAGGIGRNGDLLLTPVREQVTRLVPYPPRIDVSSLGDDAVLAGALAVARRVALDHVFTHRTLHERTTG